jgi:hypothetical protein
MTIAIERTYSFPHFNLNKSSSDAAAASVNPRVAQRNTEDSLDNDGRNFVPAGGDASPDQASIVAGMFLRPIVLEPAA